MVVALEKRTIPSLGSNFTYLFQTNKFEPTFHFCKEFPTAFVEYSCCESCRISSCGQLVLCITGTFLYFLNGIQSLCVYTVCGTGGSFCVHQQDIGVTVDTSDTISLGTLTGCAVVIVIILGNGGKLIGTFFISDMTVFSFPFCHIIPLFTCIIRII